MHNPFCAMRPVLLAAGLAATTVTAGEQPGSLDPTSLAELEKRGRISKLLPYSGSGKAYTLRIRSAMKQVPSSCLPDRRLGADEAGRQLGADEEGRQLGADEEGRRLGADEQGRNLGADEEGRRLGAAEQGRDLGSDEEGRQLGADEEGRRLGAAEQGRNLGSDEEGRRLGADEQGRNLGADEEGRNLGADEEGRRLGADETTVYCWLGRDMERVLLVPVTDSDVHIPAASVFAGKSPVNRQVIAIEIY